MKDSDLTYWQRLESVMAGSEYDTPTKLGRKIGCASQTISHIKHGKSESLSAKIQTKVCQLFGINEHWLLTGEGVKESTRSFPVQQDEFTQTLLDHWAKLSPMGKAELLLHISKHQDKKEEQPPKKGRHSA